MRSSTKRLRLALAALDLYQTPKKVAAGLRRGFQEVERHWAGLEEPTRRRLVDEVEELDRRDVDVCFYGDDRYPSRLAQISAAPPLLFMWGNPDLFQDPSVSMCGSRHASLKGLGAAQTCGLEVAAHGLTIVSGYAKGVDTETHLAALRSGGRTIIVLAEGILHFRVKRSFRDAGLQRDHVLVLSQFPPAQRWNVGAAMTRNRVISGLGRALVVIEAGETGGTLNAGLQALEMGRPVLALEFSEGTPAGNEILFAKGALRIDRRSVLGKALDTIEDPAVVEWPTRQSSLLSSGYTRAQPQPC